eukprot:m.119355 g.119355  ORF g.119355 m.119355 type:complete len:97 (+) comp14313_c0_seq2:638-928(+)
MANVERNLSLFPQCEVAVAELNWFNHMNDIKTIRSTYDDYDFLIASDVTYMRPAHEPLAATLAELSRHNHPLLVLGHESRIMVIVIKVAFVSCLLF